MTLERHLSKLIKEFGHGQAEGYEVAASELLVEASGSFYTQAECLSAIRFAYGREDSAPEVRSNIDSLFLPIVSKNRNIFDKRNPSGPHDRILQVDQTADPLASTRDRWSMMKTLARLQLQNIEPLHRLAIVTTVRDEGLSILEWLAFHRGMGVQEFFVYTNDNTDGSFALLLLLAKAGEIFLIENSLGSKVSPQQKSYEHSLYALPELRKYDWVAYLDVDEFINVKCVEDGKINILLDMLENTPSYDKPSSIYLNWRWFGSSNQIRMNDVFVTERFQDTRADSHGKSITRLNDIISMRPVHYPALLPGCYFVNSDFQPFLDFSDLKPSYNFAQINHYWNKSFEEFLLKKYRGLPSRGIEGEQRSFSQFFEWDVKNGTTEKINEQQKKSMMFHYNRLKNIPGITECLSIVVQNIKEKISTYEKTVGIAELYKQFSR